MLIPSMSSKEFWDEIITTLTPVFGPVVLAGGAVRDCVLGYEPKDYDLFVNVKSDLELQIMGWQLPEFNFYLKTAEFDPDGYMIDMHDNGVPEVSGVLEGVYKGKKVQVVARPSETFNGSEIVSKFDLGLCQFWYEGGKVYGTPQAWQDKEQKKATLLRIESSLRREKSIERFQRFNSRDGGRGFIFIDTKFLEAQRFWLQKAIQSKNNVVFDEFFN